MEFFTFAGDESGDVSFAFDKGASRYFVIAAIGTDRPGNLRQSMENLRTQNGLPTHYEFSFHGLSSARLRSRVFAAMAKCDFTIWAVVIDKTTLSDAFRAMRRIEFYAFFVAELIKLLPENKREHATLLLDEFDTSGTKKAITEIRRVCKALNVRPGFRRISAKRSQSEMLIQAADLVAGAILRRDAKLQGESFDAISSKIGQIVEFLG